MPQYSGAVILHRYIDRSFKKFEDNVLYLLPKRFFITLFISLKDIYDPPDEVENEIERKK